MIILSSGHNPSHPGACWEGRCEHETANGWVERVYSELSFRTDVIVVPTGHLKQKVKFINEALLGVTGPSIAMEIHFNACGGCAASGTETLYCPDSVKGKQVAEVIQHGLVSALGTRDRGVKEGWFRMDRPGIKDYPGDVDGDESPDYFLRATHCPAIIPEPEFIHNMHLVEDLVQSTCEVLAGQLMLALEGLKDGSG